MSIILGRNNGGQRLTLVQRALILTLKQQGLSTSAIAMAVGCAAPTVLYWLRRSKPPVPPSGGGEGG